MQSPREVARDYWLRTLAEAKRHPENADDPAPGARRVERAMLAAWGPGWEEHVEHELHA